jgi:hypothetical protein
MAAGCCRAVTRARCGPSYEVTAVGVAPTPTPTITLPPTSLGGSQGDQFNERGDRADPIAGASPGLRRQRARGRRPMAIPKPNPAATSASSAMTTMAVGSSA